jgi:hypothetical protein
MSQIAPSNSASCALPLVPLTISFRKNLAANQIRPTFANTVRKYNGKNGNRGTKNQAKRRSQSLHSTSCLAVGRKRGLAVSFDP